MWTAARMERVRKLYEARKSPSEIANLLGCSRMAIYKLLWDKGWARRCGQKIKLSIETMDKNPKKFLRLYESTSAQALAKETGLNLRGVIKWLKDQGVFREDHGDRHAVAVKSGRHSSVTKVNSKLASYFALDCDKLHPLEYKIMARKLTTSTFKRYRELIDPENTRSYAVHVDHLFSLHYGLFGEDGVPRKKRVPLWMIGHPANLRMLARSANSKRHTGDRLASDLTALKKRIEKFNRKHGNPYE